VFRAPGNSTGYSASLKICPAVVVDQEKKGTDSQLPDNNSLLVGVSMSRIRERVGVVFVIGESTRGVGQVLREMRENEGICTANRSKEPRRDDWTSSPSLRDGKNVPVERVISLLRRDNCPVCGLLLTPC
jgi:hypothetical protein